MDIDRFASLLGNFGEFFGSIAVVFTLVYLALQVRQNSRALSIGARQHVLDKFSDAIRHIVSEPATRAVTAKALNRYEDLNNDEQVHFAHFMMLFSTNVYDAFLLNRDTDLHDDAFRWVANAFIGTCSTPGGKTWWNEYSGMMGDSGASLSPEFIEFINRQLRSDLKSGEAVGQLWRAPPNSS